MHDSTKEIIKILDRYSYRKSRIDVFKDACEYNALTLACLFDPFKKQERNKRRKEILDGYTGQDKSTFETICNKITEMLSNMLNCFDDYLGDIYMNIQAGNKHLGQTFTPYHVAKFMALIQLPRKPTQDKVHTVLDPCCGSGIMSVAVADVLNGYDFNYAQHAVMMASDIDIACVHMAYLQISYCGMPAVIQHKNALTNEYWDSFVTPAFSLQYGKFYNALKGEILWTKNNVKQNL